MDAVVKCRRCGHLVPVPGWFDELTPENAALAAARMLCDSCATRPDPADEERRREQELAEQQERLDAKYRDRIEESQLDLYALGFDPNHPQANRPLMKWMLQNVNRCVWIVGESGKCKTRVVQAAAREACRDRHVRYWPALDLAARLTETAKHPEAQLRDIYFSDLLILEDLGKEPLTAARLASINAIVDRRYTGWDQVRRLQGTDHATFGLGTGSGRLGGQIWITSQIGPEELAAKLAAVDSADATAIIRRLAEMCELHRA